MKTSDFNVILCPSQMCVLPRQNILSWRSLSFASGSLLPPHIACLQKKHQICWPLAMGSCSPPRLTHLYMSVLPRERNHMPPFKTPVAIWLKQGWVARVAPSLTSGTTPASQNLIRNLRYLFLGHTVLQLLQTLSIVSQDN